VAVSKFQVYNIRETYHELGKYWVKVVLNPRYYRAAHEFRVDVVDSDGRQMSNEVSIWGRKINVGFDITPDTADGVSIIKIIRGKDQIARLPFWVIKP
jgi:hypothetical protein